MKLYEQAVKEKEERLGLGDPAAVERHDRLSVELEGLNVERKGNLRQNARGCQPVRVRQGRHARHVEEGRDERRLRALPI